MKDFIPEGEDAGSPTGKGGYRDFVPQEEIDAKRVENESKKEVKEEIVEKKGKSKGPKRGKKHSIK